MIARSTRVDPIYRNAWPPNAGYRVMRARTAGEVPKRIVEMAPYTEPEILPMIRRLRGVA